jgi:hypothetical protein
MNWGNKLKMLIFTKFSLPAHSCKSKSTLSVKIAICVNKPLNNDVYHPIFLSTASSPNAVNKSEIKKTHSWEELKDKF